MRHELNEFVLRRDAAFLKTLLGEKHEWVIVCRMSDIQNKLYKDFLRVSKIQKRRRSNVVVIIIVHYNSCNYRKNYFDSFISLLMCSLQSQLQN